MEEERTSTKRALLEEEKADAMPEEKKPRLLPPIQEVKYVHFLKPEITPMKHQDEAVDWHRMREATPHMGIRGGMLHGEPGIGKTLIGLLTVFGEVGPGQRLPGPTLIVGPKPILQEGTAWRADLAKMIHVCSSALLS